MGGPDESVPVTTHAYSPRCSTTVTKHNHFHERKLGRIPRSGLEINKRLRNNSYSVPDAYKWGILKKGILEVHNTCVGMINLYFKNIPYHKVKKKFRNSHEKK